MLVHAKYMYLLTTYFNRSSSGIRSSSSSTGPKLSGRPKLSPAELPASLPNPPLNKKKRHKHELNLKIPPKFQCVIYTCCQMIVSSNVPFSSWTCRAMPTSASIWVISYAIELFSYQLLFFVR